MNRNEKIESVQNKMILLLSTYNGARYLPEQLASLAAQKLQCPIHLMARDDGSSDDTCHVLDAFAQQVAMLPKQVTLQSGCNTINTFTTQTATMPYAVASQMDTNVAVGFTKQTVQQPAQRKSETPFTFSVTKGKNLGFIKSFFTLLKEAPDDAAWYAFCDQDDVWLPEKLQRAVDCLNAADKATERLLNSSNTAENASARPINCLNATENASDLPLLYTSRLQLTDAALKPIGLSKKALKAAAFANALVENIVTSATIVMNPAARNILLAGFSEHFEDICQGTLLHDWWCYLVVSAFGKVVYDSKSTILYRQHGQNTVGQKISFLARQKNRLKRFSKNGHFSGISKQAKLFQQVYLPGYKSQISEKNINILNHFCLKNTSFINRLRYALQADVYRQSWYDSILMKLLILLNRI